jgi:hypothetical protein
MKSCLRNISTLFTCGIITCLTGCSASSKPILYPNSHLESQSKAQVDADIKYCMDLADSYVKDPSKYQELAKTGLTAGAIGAGAGALGGVIMGSNVGRSVGAGAAVGAVVAVAHDLISKGDHSPNYESFANHCLSKKGYEVTGWK